jgi:DNA repair protein RecN (Recombination protein N)
LSLLDSFARTDHQLTEYGNYYRQLQVLLAEHAALNTAETAREQELDLLRHQVSEIKSANLALDEEEEIENRYKLASNSKRLIELASAIANKLSEADDSVLSQLAETQRLLRELEKIDSSIAQFSSAHAASVVELSEIARALSAYAEKLDLDPEQLAALEQRVSLFETLKRKYGGSIAEVISFGERAAERMQKIEGRDAELERLAKEIENVRSQMNRAGEALCKLRRKAAPKLSENIRRNLRDLGFRQSEFEAKLTVLEEPRPNMPPVEVGQHRGSRVGAQLGCQCSIIQKSDNSATQGLAIMIRNDESIMQMAHAFASASEGNDRFSSEHVVQ